jgi:hypothetical protein
MDHLPQIVKPAVEALEIPYLCQGIEYDGLDFQGFSERMGWELIVSEQGLATLRRIRGDNEDSIQATLGFIQSWLYFGMLSEVLKVFGLQVDISQFKRWKNGARIITTACLRDYIVKWSKQSEAGSNTHSRLELAATAGRSRES